MWIQVHLCTCHGSRELAYAVRRPAASQLVGEIFGLVVGE